MGKKLAISFSGGRTSAVMTHILWEQYKKGELSYDHIEITFANTGCEHHATLDFVRACEFEFGWPVVWIEAVVGTKGVGIRHSITDYENADREGRVFESYIQKYGIPNRNKPQCTARLKEEAMESYLRTKGYKFSRTHGYGHDTAIGIRADEMDRMSANREKRRFIYPLVDAGMNKRDVAMYIKKHFPFDLQIKGDHYGNCVWCWKKSNRKLYTLALEDPSVFDFPARMEEKYKKHKSKNEFGVSCFFRGRKTAEDIKREALDQEFNNPDWSRYEDDPWDHGKQAGLFDDRLDVGGACGDSCEIGADE
ncbi:MAG: phosphoadenosine phosphosulfate reductase family protein [Epibacterium sp.]|nr:phosphoadenosine phosphosulfate reductase family protein [Epibacterium sp.]NQX74128.1 phosphoadenosine phosphosulfate reductase family protein [Epibacterium sp.]